jgi:undecaprenyl-diphosphatase
MQEIHNISNSMTILQALILGIVQGLTEFLPVSSSAHLVIVPYLLGWNIPPTESFVFDVLVQLATLLAVLIYFWRDLVNIARAFILGLWHKQPFADPNARLGWYIILATVPAGLAGVTIKDLVEQAFANPNLTALLLLVTAGLLLVGERTGRRVRTLEQVTWLDALAIGLFQAISIFPGVSRSGATITGGMARNLERPAAARFSFLMSIPIMLAAGLLTTLDLLEIPNLGQVLPVFIPGFVSSAIVGYLAIHWLLKFLNKYPLYGFAVYCVLACIITLGSNLLPKQAPTAAELPPTPQTVTVLMTPALQPWHDVLRTCGTPHPNVAILITETPASAFANQVSDLALRVGPSRESDYAQTLPFSAQVGWEQLTIIINSTNPLILHNTLSPQDLLAFYLDLPTPPTTTLHAWTYPPASDLRQAFDTAILGGLQLTSQAQLASDPQAMLEAIGNDPLAIGYIPEEWLAKPLTDVKPVSVNKELAELLRQPILALATAEPQQTVRTILLCLQNTPHPGY